MGKRTLPRSKGGEGVGESRGFQLKGEQQEADKLHFLGQVSFSMACGGETAGLEAAPARGLDVHGKSREAVSVFICRFWFW